MKRLFVIATSSMIALGALAVTGPEAQAYPCASTAPWWANIGCDPNPPPPLPPEQRPYDPRTNPAGYHYEWGSDPNIGRVWCPPTCP